MNELITVNIYNKNRIPWMNIQGPLMNVAISRRLYTLLSNDPSIKMDVLNAPTSNIVYTPVPAEAKQEKNTNESFNAVDDIKITEVKTETVEETKADDVLDVKDSSDEINSADDVDETIETSEEVSEAVVNTDDEVKIYSEEELMLLTKAQLKAILIGRGYTTGTLAPKYADTHPELVRKVLETQETNKE